MFIQTQQTPNPNSLKFLTEKKVSLVGPIEFKDKSETSVSLIKNILSINGVTGIFLSDDYLSVNKDANSEWEDLKHIIISYINDFYDQGNECIISEKRSENSEELSSVKNTIIKIHETKERPAVARDGGDIKFKDFKDGKVIVELQGSCSGCPSSTLTLKKGVQNLSLLRQVDKLESFMEDKEYVSSPISLVTFIKASRQAYYNNNPSFCLLYTSPSPRDQRGSRMPADA